MLLFTIPLVSGVCCQSTALCWGGEVASIGDHPLHSVNVYVEL